MRFGLALLLLALAAPASAQDVPDDLGGADASADVADDAELPAGEPRMPQRLATRPITQPRNTLRLSLFMAGWGADTGGFAEDFVVSLQLGGAYGITDDLEIGVGTESMGIAAVGAGAFARSGWRPVGEGLLSFLILDDDLDFGDIPLYGRYRFFQNDLVEIGGELGLLIPTYSDFAVRFGVPVRLHFGELFAVDTGLYASMTFGPDPSNGDPDDDFWGALFLPLRAVVSPTDWLGLALVTGMHTGPFDGEFFAIPLGFEATASFPMGTESLLDLVAGFEWPALIRPATNGDVAQPSTWTLSAGARFYLAVGD